MPDPVGASPWSGSAGWDKWRSRWQMRSALRSACCRIAQKKGIGLWLGADHYYATSDAEIFSTLVGTFDLIINTVSADLDLDAYLRLLAVDGVLFNVAAPATPLSLNAFSLLTNAARSMDR
jgi:D-arabinose 1-dehydrogenase-like Zn-dependent alcohol dehydrogenase